jgi:hypothetical protein
VGQRREGDIVTKWIEAGKKNRDKENVYCFGGGVRKGKGNNKMNK